MVQQTGSTRRAEDEAINVTNFYDDLRVVSIGRLRRRAWL
jgi:hypothetical protein